MRTAALFLLILLLMGVTSQPVVAALRVVSQDTAQVLEYDETTGAFLGVYVDAVLQGFAFPGGIAIRPTDGALFVAGTASGEIWVYDAATGEATPPPPATGLLAPGWLAFAASGATLYFIADIPNGPDTDAAVRKLTIAGGAVSTLDSDATASFSALALEGSNLYVSDSFNGEIVRIPAAGGNGTTVISGLMSPGGILFLSPTSMLVAETSADRVVEYQDGGGGWAFVREVLPASAGVDGPLGLALAPDGRLTVAGSLSRDAVAVDLTTLVVSPLVAAGAGGLSAAGQITWNGNTLMIANRSGNSILYYDQNGNPTGVQAQGLTPPPDAGLTPMPGGRLLVASSSANSVTAYDATGASAFTLSNACPLSLTDPFDVTLDSNEDIYVSCGPTDGVRRFNELGIPISFVLPGAGGLSAPRGLAFGPGGNLFVASLTGEVLEYDGTDGSFVGTFVDATGNGGGPVDPYGLVFHGGSLFVASFFANEVKEFDASTGSFVQTLVAAGAGGLSGPSGLAFGPGGDLYVTSSGDDTIKRYDDGSGAYLGDFVTSGSGGLDRPFDLAFTPPDIPVPSIGSGGLAAVVVLLGSIGIAGLGRRRE